MIDPPPSRSVSSSTLLPNATLLCTGAFGAYHLTFVARNSRTPPGFTASGGETAVSVQLSAISSSPAMEGQNMLLSDNRLLGVQPLEKLSREDVLLFGAKAVNLAVMKQQGLPVPNGFVLAFSVQTPSEATQLTSAEREHILQAHATLVGPNETTTVAVRSSAIGEDSEDASFAGQHDTVLNVSGDDALLDAINRCVASLASDRVSAYRTEMNAPVEGMGIVVQVMAPADFAGVCFTRSPRADEEVVVEVIRGLGEALVSGKERPARISYRRADLEPSSTTDRLAAKPNPLPVSQDDHGGILDELGREKTLEVARLALGAEHCFSCALDVEWAYGRGACWLLQARPITAQSVDVEREDIRSSEIARLQEIAARRTTVWSDLSVADMLPNPSPFSVALFQRLALYDGGMGRAFRRIGFKYDRRPRARHCFEMICGRLFLNLSVMLRTVLSDMPLMVKPEALTSDDTAEIHMESLPTKIAWSDWRNLLRFPWAIGRWLVLVPFRFISLRRRFYDQYQTRLLPAAQQEAARLRGQNLTSLPDADLFSTLFAHLDRLCGELFSYHQLSDIFAFGGHFLLKRNLRKVYGSRADEMEIQLTTGLSGNFNTESNLALARVARGSLSLEDFLDQYGHRGNPDWEVSAPRWRESSERVEHMVELIRKSNVDPKRQFQQQQEIRRKAEERFHDDIGKKWLLRPWRRLIMSELRHYQRYSPLREATQSVCYLWIELIGRVLTEISERTGAGALLYYLTPDELRAGSTRQRLKPLLEKARARKRRLRLSRSIYVPHMFSSEQLDRIGRLPELTKDVQELRGQMASTGIAQGRARVVSSLDEAQHLEQGEILVTASTDPAWTPLFLVASGLVLEQGGMLSHGVIVAREYGLPAVINVPHVTRRLKTGQQITVDGDRGVVTVQGAGEPEST